MLGVLRRRSQRREYEGSTPTARGKAQNCVNTGFPEGVVTGSGSASLGGLGCWEQNQSSLRQTDPAKQIGKAWIGANTLASRINLQIQQGVVTLPERFF